MKRLFLQLTMANLVLLGGVVVWGHFRSAPSEGGLDFMSLVVIVAIFSSLVHSIFYTYFIATAKFVERAVEEHGYSDTSAPAQAKLNKRKSFNYGFLAILSVIVASSFAFNASPVRQELAGTPFWAAVFAYLAVVMNLYAAKIEWKYIVRNCVITDAIFAEIEELNTDATTAQ